VQEVYDQTIGFKFIGDAVLRCFVEFYGQGKTKATALSRVGFGGDLTTE